MNSSNAKDYLPLVQALAEGKEIQMKNGAGIWTSYRDMDFCLIASEYRVKPEPREIWANRYPDGSESPAYSSREEAVDDAGLDGVGTAKQICYREVIE